MKYLICWLHTDEDEDGVLTSEIAKPTACDDIVALGNGLRDGLVPTTPGLADTDWAIFELVDGRFERRSVTFAPDGSIASVQ